MATDFGLLWRVALIAILREDATLKAVFSDPLKVYDSVPQDLAVPYIRVGDDLIKDYGDKTEAGMEIFCGIHFFDGSPTQRGQKRINLAQARVYELLHERPTVGDTQILLSGRPVYLIRFQDRTVRNVDGCNWHGIDRYRILV